MAFFNILSGGPAKGPEYLVDSNIDWGQDVKKLKNWWASQGRPSLCTALIATSATGDFRSSSVVEYYGMSHNSLPTTSELPVRRNLDCVGAISVTLLKDDYMHPGDFEWLRK